MYYKKMFNRSVLIAGASLLLSLLSGYTCADTAQGAATRQAYFGDLHLHTALSLDAWTYGTKLLPDDAYRFARGLPVTVPGVQVSRQQGLRDQGVSVRRRWPLDFLAVSDHSESMGILNQLDDPDNPFTRSKTGQDFITDPRQAQIRLAGRRVLGDFLADLLLGELPDGLESPTVARDAWSMTKQAANDHYTPGVFTTFIAYEWGSMPRLKNLHRNVIFSSDDAPLPFTAETSSAPEDLWTYLEESRSAGTDVIAIPHNSNVSDGLMFDWETSDGKSIDRAYAERRIRNEPLVEIVQVKGQSDTTPSLSPGDTFADFEIFDHLLGMPKLKSDPAGSYVRNGLGRGLIISSQAGANPFQFGLVGGSDIHNGLSTSDESAFSGDAFGTDPTAILPPKERAELVLGFRDEKEPGLLSRFLNLDDDRRKAMLERSSGGLTGVWAEENTRDAIFSALKRRETFATTGTRIRLRVFSGWKYPSNLTNDLDWVHRAYADGIPMGQALPTRPAGSSNSPLFAIHAMKDPDGADLQRVQMIKLWLDGHRYREAIFELTPSESGTSGNNLSGKSLVATVWEDPEFNADIPALYYVRVLEEETPRWSTRLARKHGLPSPDLVPEYIQERAWSSPIWFDPDAQ